MADQVWYSLNVPMRGALESSVKALKKLKDVGSAAASLDAIHAVLPWAAIFLMLTDRVLE